MNTIFTVTTLKCLNTYEAVTPNFQTGRFDKKVKIHDSHWMASSTMVGWFSTKEDAICAVIRNDMDIHEDTYNYVVIEEVCEGLYGEGEDVQYWYVWNDDDNKYELCEQPSFAYGTIHFYK